MRRARAALLAAALLLFASARADAADRPRIVVFGGREESAVARLSAELTAIGFDVVADEHTEGASRERLEQAARAASAVAAIRLVRSTSGVEAWIVDRITGKLVLREIVGAELAGGGDGLLALRAVELLRASLLEVDEPHASRGDVPIVGSVREAVKLPVAAAPPPLTAGPPLAAIAAAARPITAAPATARWRPAFEVGPAMLLGSGGLAPMLHARLALTLDYDRLGATAWALLPLVADSVTGSEGIADVRVLALASGGRLELGPSGAPWSVPLGAGAAIAWIEARGHAASGGYEGRIDTALTGGPYASAGFSCAITAFARVDATVTSGVLLPPQGIYLGHREAARFGPAFVVASVGLSFGEVNRGEAVLRLKP